MRTLALLLLVACTHPVGPDPVVPPVSPAQANAAAPASPAAPAAAPTHAVAASTAPAAGERFDEIVRNDFFDGLRGDAVALDRVLRFCEDTLARQPGHPEAMVWHGGATIARSVNAFRTGDRATGMALYTRGLSEMDRAVELAPGDIGVRIPRGAVVLSMAPFVPEPEKSRLWQRGVADYEVALAAQAPRFSTLTQHAREQLLYGLLDGYAGLGNTAKAETYYQRMTVDAAGSQLLGRAKARAAGQPVTGATPCQECHGR